MIVDDDLLSREVLGLLAAEAGFEVSCHESGEAALESLEQPDAVLPDAVLADMQMPGICGDSFARLLRVACGPATALLAMSGTGVPAERATAFDTFLLKPFSIEDLEAALDALGESAPNPAQSSEADLSGMLSQPIFNSFSQSMSSVQLGQLYKMCLDDADSRIQTMRGALDAKDADAFRRAAHSIKGGCGMVGALELARLATVMEELEPETIDSSVPPFHLLDEFLAASARLRRMLDLQLK